MKLSFKNICVINTNICYESLYTLLSSKKCDDKFITTIYKKIFNGIYELINNEYAPYGAYDLNNYCLINEQLYFTKDCVKEKISFEDFIKDDFSTKLIDSHLIKFIETNEHFKEILSNIQLNKLMDFFIDFDFQFFKYNVIRSFNNYKDILYLIYTNHEMYINLRNQIIKYFNKHGFADIIKPKSKLSFYDIIDKLKHRYDNQYFKKIYYEIINKLGTDIRNFLEFYLLGYDSKMIFTNLMFIIKKSKNQSKLLYYHPSNCLIGYNKQYSSNIAINTTKYLQINDIEYVILLPNIEDHILHYSGFDKCKTEILLKLYKVDPKLFKMLYEITFNNIVEEIKKYRDQKYYCNEVQCSYNQLIVEFRKCIQNNIDFNFEYDKMIGSITSSVVQLNKCSYFIENVNSNSFNKNSKTVEIKNIHKYYDDNLPKQLKSISTIFVLNNTTVGKINYLKENDGMIFSKIMYLHKPHIYKITKIEHKKIKVNNKKMKIEIVHINE